MRAEAILPICMVILSAGSATGYALAREWRLAAYYALAAALNAVVIR